MDESPDVILVETDSGLVAMLLHGLRNLGFSVAHYADGQAALVALCVLQTSAKRPLLVLEVDLPSLDGLALQERLNGARPKAFRTVFLTARRGEADQLRAYHAGAPGYLVKPVNLQILLAEMKQWVDGSRDQR